MLTRLHRLVILGPQHRKSEQLWVKLRSGRAGGSPPQPLPSPQASLEYFWVTLGLPMSLKVTGLVQPSHLQMMKLRPRVGSHLPKVTQQVGSRARTAARTKAHDS